MSHSAKALRKSMRERRQQLSVEQHQQASERLTQQLMSHLPQGVKRVALYLANDGEINPQSFIDFCWLKQIEVYLPVIHPFCPGYLLFLRYHANTPMQTNQYGIAEPVLDVRYIAPVNTLDIMYTPLVAFDHQGNRMGMGGGYYDRTLAAHPQLRTLGLAHDCQQVEQLNTQIWDMPLTGIITPTQHIAIT